MSEPFLSLPLGSAGVILADPPWNFITYSPKGWKKSAHRHYPCMSLDAIAALPVTEFCAPDCVLVLWHTQTHAPHALHVLNQWGFAKPSQGAWAKQSKTGTKWAFGTGYLMRSAAEFWIVATRGRPKQLSRSFRNLIVAPVREHSRKPDEMYEQIEATWPGPYVELFARYKRAGWHQWPEPAAPSETPRPELEKVRAAKFADCRAAQGGNVASNIGRPSPPRNSFRQQITGRNAMGEARRRKRRPVDLNTALRDIEQIGQGVWVLNIYSSEAVAGALLGDPDDDLILDLPLLRRAIKQIERHRGPGGPMCLLCTAEFSRATLPRAVVLLRPGIDALRAAPGSGRWVISNGLCDHCACLPELRTRVLDAYRRALIPNAREIRIAEAGAA